MYKCSKCSGEFKSNAGLAKHEKSCSVVKEEVVLSDNVKRMIEKLKDAAKSCQDAEHRHKLEQEWKRLENEA
jgi:hypothetical protein